MLAHCLKNLRLHIYDQVGAVMLRSQKTASSIPLRDDRLYQLSTAPARGLWKLAPNIPQWDESNDPLKLGSSSTASDFCIPALSHGWAALLLPPWATLRSWRQLAHPSCEWNKWAAISRVKPAVIICFSKVNIYNGLLKQLSGWSIISKRNLPPKPVSKQRLHDSEEFTMPKPERC